MITILVMFSNKKIVSKKDFVLILIDCLRTQPIIQGAIKYNSTQRLACEFFKALFLTLIVRSWFPIAYPFTFLLCQCAHRLTAWQTLLRVRGAAMNQSHVITTFTGHLHWISLNHFYTPLSLAPNTVPATITSTGENI